MHFLTTTECAEWCRKHSVRLSDGQIPDEPAVVGMPTVRFGVPERLVGLLSFSATLAEWFEDGSERLLWITAEHHALQLEELYRRMRRGHDDRSRVSDRPGHLFGADEIDELGSFLVVVLLVRGRGCLISDTGAQLLIPASGWLEYGSNDIAGLEQKRAQLRDEEVPLFAARSA